MANTLQVKRHATFNESKNPTTNQLAEGEFGWNNHGKRLWIGNKTGASTVGAYEVNPIATLTTAGLASFADANFAISGTGAVTIDGVSAATITSGTLPNARLSSIPASALAGSIGNSKLSNSAISISDGSSSPDAISLGGTIVVAGTTNEVTASQSGGTVTVGLPDDVTLGGDLVVTGDLTVNGDTVTANVGTITVEDKTIEVAKTGSPTDTTANGAGLLVTGADAKTFYYASSGDKWTMNKPLTVTGVVTATGGNSGSWNTAYGWGNHASAGYITGLGTALVDADFSSNGIMKRTGAGAYGIVTDSSANWNTAYGWGNHGSAGYLTSLGTALLDADFSSNGIMKRTGAGAYGIVTDSSANWNTAYGWGDHSTAGYITGLGTALLDADFSSNGLMKRSSAGTYAIVTDSSANWNTAYGWGNHASAGYISSLGTALVDADFSSNGLMKRSSAGTYAIVTDSSSNWNTAYTDRLKWDGGSTGLTASTGRTSLGLTTAWVQGNHATYDSHDIDTTGVEVVDVLTVNNTGHVTAASKRSLSLADFGVIDGGTATWTTN